MKFATVLVATAFAALASATPIPQDDQTPKDGDSMCQQQGGTQRGVIKMGPITNSDGAESYIGPIYKCQKDDTIWYTGNNPANGAMYQKEKLKWAADEACDKFKNDDELQKKTLCLLAVRHLAETTQGFNVHDMD